MSALGRVAAAVPPLAVLALTATLHLPLCGALFRCGCVTPWAGGSEHCNIHAAQGPHCPWCAHTGVGAAAFGVTLAGPVVAYVLVRRRKASVGASTLAAVAAVPVAALLSGAATWIATDYPHFLAKDARARLGLPAGPLPCGGGEPGH
jgi:hypothetical protein